MDRPRAIHGNVRQEAAFHQVDEMTAYPSPKNVSTREQDTRAVTPTCFHEARPEQRNRRVRKRRERPIERQYGSQVQVMLPVRQWLDVKPRTIEGGIRHDAFNPRRTDNW